MVFEWKRTLSAKRGSKRGSISKKEQQKEQHPLLKPVEVLMSIKDIVRAWKDSEYRESLSEEQRALLPKMPIGAVLSDEELLTVTGGANPDILVTDTVATNRGVVGFCFPRC